MRRKPLGMIVGGMMSAMFRELKRRTSERTDSKLTIDQVGLLYAISQNDRDVTQQDMAELMLKDKSSILRMIDSLENKELVRRAVDREDRRKNQIFVTKKGERTIEQYLQIEFELMDELLDGLSADDLDAFYRVVNHIRTRAEGALFCANS